MLDKLTQTDTTSVWAHGDAKLSGQQQVRDILVDAGYSSRVDLENVDGLGLQKLFEHHPVLHDFSSRDLDWSDSPPDRGMPEDIVCAGGLLDPIRIVGSEFGHPLNRLSDVPFLIGVSR